MSTSGGSVTPNPGYSFVPAPSIEPGLMPTGAFAENISRYWFSSGDRAINGTSIPELFPGPHLPAGKAVGNIRFYQSTVAPAVQLHAWLAICDLTGKVLAVSADALTVPWGAGTFTYQPVPIAYTPAVDTDTLIAVSVTATTGPTWRGPSESGSPLGNFTPIYSGQAASGAQILPPAVGTQLTLPAAYTSAYPYVCATP